VYSSVLVLCLNLGRTYTFHCRRKSKRASKWLGFLVNVPFWSAPEIVTTFVTEPPSLLWIACRTSFRTPQKSRENFSSSSEDYINNNVFVSPAPPLICRDLFNGEAARPTRSAGCGCYAAFAITHKVPPHFTLSRSGTHRYALR
jgi:hypothetical protein